MKNKTIVGIDIDGTLADTMEMWLSLYKKEFNVLVSKDDIVII